MAMTQRFIDVRVRPPRVSVLIDRDAQDEDLLLAIEFLSKLWGGRYGHILAVGPQSIDELTRFRLRQIRPDFVYGIGLPDDHWRPAVHEACQPRGYGPLRPDFVRGLKKGNREDHNLIDQALIDLSGARHQSRGRKRSLRLVSPHSSSALAIYCAATFGVHHEDLREEFFDVNTPFADSTPAAFLDLATEFANGWQMSWLDVSGHKLSQYVVSGGQLPPTIVLVRHQVPDLCLFWNLRSASSPSGPAWIIPIPFAGARNAKVLAKIKDWLISFLPYGMRPNYCQVTSQTVSEKQCRGLAEKLQSVLSGTHIEAVDYCPPRNRLPVVVPFEYKSVWPVEVSGSTLAIRPPRPKAFEVVGSPPSWFVDLIKDVKTGRAVKDQQLPPGPVAFEVLNGPCPTGVLFAAIPVMGVGVDSLSLRCSGDERLVNIHMPSGEEVLEEILWEHSLEPIFDEKRSSYLPVIRRLGGLYRAAESFSGTLGHILRTMKERGQKDERSPMSLAEIKGACKLGKEGIPGTSFAESAELLLRSASERVKRIGRNRFARHGSHESPKDSRLISRLEYWADRSILTRQWKIGPCSQCNRTSFLPRLNIQRKVICPHCANRINLPEAVPLVYDLHPTLRLSMKEGIVPVVLTGRFLRSMTSRGFLWLPGVKYKIDDRKSDIDLLACCDGLLVFCECKALETAPPDEKCWDEVVAQFLETASVAKMCGADLVVLAGLVDEYTAHVQERIVAGLASDLPFLLLTRRDLEVGRREVEDHGHVRSLWWSDIVPVPFPERVGVPTDKQRTIHTGWGVHASSLIP